MNSIELSVQGMSCGACVKHVTQALMPLTGVTAVEVDLPAGRVRVSGAPDIAQLLTTLDEAGYPAQLASVSAPDSATQGGCSSHGGCGCH